MTVANLWSDSGWLSHVMTHDSSMLAFQNTISELTYGPMVPKPVEVWFMICVLWFMINTTKLFCFWEIVQLYHFQLSIKETLIHMDVKININSFILTVCKYTNWRTGVRCDKWFHDSWFTIHCSLTIHQLKTYVCVDFCFHWVMIYACQSTRYMTRDMLFLV